MLDLFAMKHLTKTMVPYFTIDPDELGNLTFLIGQFFVVQAQHANVKHIASFLLHQLRADDLV